MRFPKILAAVLVILAIVIFAARTVMRMRMYKGSRDGERIKMGAATSFYYNASGGSYMNSGETYSAELSGDIVTIRIRLDGVYEEDAEQFETDPSFMKQIDSILEKYNVKKWNGFSLSNQMVLDGRGSGFPW